MSAPGIRPRVAKCDGCGIVAVTWHRPGLSHGDKRRFCVACIDKPHPDAERIKALANGYQTASAYFRAGKPLERFLRVFSGSEWGRYTTEAQRSAFVQGFKARYADLADAEARAVGKEAA